MVEEEITSEPVNAEESLNRIKRGTVFSFSTPESFKSFQYPNYQSFGNPGNIVIQSGYDSSGMQHPKVQETIQDAVQNMMGHINNYQPYTRRQPTRQQRTECNQYGNQVIWKSKIHYLKLISVSSCVSAVFEWSSSQTARMGSKLWSIRYAIWSCKNVSIQNE